MNSMSQTFFMCTSKLIKYYAGFIHLGLWFFYLLKQHMNAARYLGLRFQRLHAIGCKDSTVKQTPPLHKWKIMT